VVELRLGTAVLLLAPWLAWRRPAALRITRADVPRFVVLGLIGVAAIQGSYYYSISVLGVGLAILLQYLAPAMIVAWQAARGVRTTWPTLASVAAAITGTALLVTGVDARAVRLKLTKGELELFGQSAGRGEARAKMEVEFKGSSAEIAFNPDCVLDGLKNCEGGQVRLQFNEKTSPGKFTLGKNYMYVVMPITVDT